MLGASGDFFGRADAEYLAAVVLVTCRVAALSAWTKRKLRKYTAQEAAASNYGSRNRVKEASLKDVQRGTSNKVKTINNAQ